ncbi:MAG: flagellar hook-associated protein 2 [Motiliproteus sp.]|jgi:flagellar hook-associated protein 2
MVQNIISSLGAGSGIDTLALVDSLIAAERAPRETQLDAKTQTYETQISGYGALRSAMSGIQDSVKLLADSDTFNGRNVAFPDSALIMPNVVEPEALAGEYSVEVLGLASAQSLSAGGFSAPDGVVGSGTLAFSFGDWAADELSFSTNDAKSVQNLTIDASNNTLAGIRDTINEADFGVQASIIEDSGSYSLQLTSASGASNELQITVTEGSPAGLAGLGYAGFPPSGGMILNQEGKDASLKVNGLTVTRESNQIDDVIAGLDFTLTQASVANETVTITITEDKSVGEQTIRDFVDIYNEFLTATQTLTARTELEEDAEDRTPGSLSADPSAKAMVNQVRALISQNVTGLSGNYTALATVGIQTQIDGSLEINEDLFRQSVDSNYSALTAVFTGANSSSDARVEVARTKATTAAGTYEVLVTTQPAKGSLAGNAITDDDAAALDLTTATGVFSGGLDSSAGDYSFKITVDGIQSDLINLSGVYADSDALIADLQAQVNGDSALSAVSAGVDFSYDSDTGSFSASSQSYGAASKVSFSSVSSDMGRFGLAGASAGVLNAGPVADAGATEIEDTSGSLTTTAAITEATFQSGSDDFSSALDLTGYNLQLSVDGVDSGLVNLTGSYSTAADLGAALESQINASLTGAAITVSYDSGNDKYSFSSNTLGSSSTVEVTAANAAINGLGIAVEAGTTGVDDSFVTPLATSGTDTYTFAYDVDGVSAGSVDLEGTYTNAEEVRADLAAQMSGVTVAYDSTSNTFSFTSPSTGNSSDIEITAVSGEMAGLGIVTASGVSGRDAATTSIGVDVSGTIDGVAAFGVGQVLLPKLGSALSGLSVRIAPGASTATITLSRGFSNELGNVLDEFLKKNGLIADRETRLDSRLEDITDDRSDLDRRMESRLAVLQAQFLAMERIVASLNTISDSLDGLVDRLPYTASN